MMMGWLMVEGENQVITTQKFVTIRKIYKQFAKFEFMNSCHNFNVVWFFFILYALFGIYSERYYDCVWIREKYNNFQQIYIKYNFDNM